MTLAVEKIPMEKELISVVVPVYNVENHLPGCLDCIANQTYRNLQIILVDDGSTDSSGDICDAFAKQDPRCMVIHKKNGGPGSARNAGKAVATGEYLFFPDSDDTFDLDMIRILHEAISRYPEYDIAISGRMTVKDRDNDTNPPYNSCGDPETAVLSKDDLVQGLFIKGDVPLIYCTNKLYRKDLLEDLWFGDYTRNEDFDFNYRIFLRTGKAFFVDLPLYRWNQRSESLTHQSDTFDNHYKCRTAILFNNWVQHTPASSKYDRLLLNALYRDMVLWEEWSRKSGNFTEVTTICNGYLKKSAISYLKNKGIPFFRKMTCLTLLTFPGFSHFLMRITSNAR